MLSLLFLRVKAQRYFVTSSCLFLDEKTVLEIWLNPGLNLTIFRGTRNANTGSWHENEVLGKKTVFGIEMTEIRDTGS